MYPHLFLAPKGGAMPCYRVLLFDTCFFYVLYMFKHCPWLHMQSLSKENNETLCLCTPLNIFFSTCVLVMPVSYLYCWGNIKCWNLVKEYRISSNFQTFVQVNIRFIFFLDMSYFNKSNPNWVSSNLDSGLSLNSHRP